MAKAKKSTVRKAKPKEIAIGKTVVAEAKGLVRNEQEAKEYREAIYKEATSDILDEIRTLIEKSEKKHMSGILLGALLSIIGGFTVASYMIAVQVDPKFAVNMYLVSFVTFVVLMIIVALTEKWLKKR